MGYKQGHFRLCYPIADKGHLFPDLLPVKEPRLLPKLEKTKDYLGFVFKYVLMPRSIISQFMVDSHKVIYEGCQWRNGVVLELNGNDSLAVIRANNKEKTITVKILGNPSFRKQHFGYVYYTFSAIHKEIEGLEVIEYVPLPDRPEYLIEYEELVGLIDKEELLVRGKLDKKYDPFRLLERYGLIQANRHRKKTLHQAPPPKKPTVIPPSILGSNNNLDNLKKKETLLDKKLSLVDTIIDQKKILAKLENKKEVLEDQVFKKVHKWYGDWRSWLAAVIGILIIGGVEVLLPLCWEDGKLPSFVSGPKKHIISVLTALFVAIFGVTNTRADWAKKKRKKRIEKKLGLPEAIQAYEEAKKKRDNLEAKLDKLKDELDNLGL